MAHRYLRFLALLAAISLAAFAAVDAQDTGLEFATGFWVKDSVATVFSLSLERPLLGPFDYGVGLTHLSGPAGAEDKDLTGGEVSLGLFRDGIGPYLVAAGGLGMRHASGNFDAQWSAGAGYAIKAIGGLSVGIEGRYRVEDRASRGFWRLHPEDSRGVVLSAVVALRFGGRGRSAATPGLPRGRSQRDRLPRPSVIPRSDSEAPRDIVELRNGVVNTALEVMGTPYAWGGEDEDGFDCSGLIQFAYGEHGLILPRTSRDQARMGQRVERAVSALRPGDILGFSEGGSGVTHVGLYVGEGMFIHSSSAGVTLSSLIDPEGDGRWWQQRWVSARRLVN